ncbi:MAG: hypothetical protein K9H64_19775 [Bacteroidales bacterium]|nr:hypothetical protein [Bacteroidales bacterium]MCF8458298.1 hypothetical protein [Bacteroidales bacterium]
MKKTAILILFVAFAFSSNAQQSKLIGSWLMIKAEVAGEVQKPYFVTEYTDDGKMIVMGMDAGTWEYNKAGNTLVLKSEFDKDFNGEGKILEISETKLVVSKDGAKLFYMKIDQDKIVENNQKSGLMGMWEFNDVPYPGANMLVTFKEPDEFNIIQKEEGLEARLNGTWIFDKQKMSLIMIGLRGEDTFKGENKVVKIDEEAIELENDGMVFKAKRKIQNTTKIERLTFSEDDFYTEDGAYKYEADEQNLPWTDPYEMINSLVNVKHLVYTFSTLIEDTEAFTSKTLTADVHANLEEESLSIDFIFYGYDNYNLPDDTELPPNSEFRTKLFPVSTNLFRIVGQEQITTSAGTFDCTVVEAIENYDTRKKLWMITDKPGIYAKIIEDTPGDFGKYNIYELQEIQ